jgi:hypothetical protein
MPLGDWGDAVGFGIGALARYEHPMSSVLRITGRIGYIHHLSKDLSDNQVGEGVTVESSASQVPLFGGLKYMFGSAYFGGELGLVRLAVTVKASQDNGPSMEQDDSEFKLGATLGAGYESGPFDVRGQLLLPSIGDVGDVQGLMATAGYSF